MGENHLPMFVLAATFEGGMPLIYSGQEAGLDYALSFFGKDSIHWGNKDFIPFYTRTLKLKHHNPALWNGNYGAPIQFITTGKEESVVAYKREHFGNHVVVFLNLSGNAFDVDYSMLDEMPGNTYTNWYAPEESHVFGNEGVIHLEAFEYKVFVYNDEMQTPQA